jgi:hypothetical protein
VDFHLCLTPSPSGLSIAVSTADLSPLLVAAGRRGVAHSGGRHSGGREHRPSLDAVLSDAASGSQQDRDLVLHARAAERFRLKRDRGQRVPLAVVSGELRLSAGEFGCSEVWLGLEVVGCEAARTSLRSRISQTGSRLSHASHRRKTRKPSVSNFVSAKIWDEDADASESGRGDSEVRSAGGGSSGDSDSAASSSAVSSSAVSSSAVSSSAAPSSSATSSCDSPASPAPSSPVPPSPSAPSAPAPRSSPPLPSPLCLPVLQHLFQSVRTLHVSHARYSEIDSLRAGRFMSSGIPSSPALSEKEARVIQSSHLNAERGWERIPGTVRSPCGYFRSMLPGEHSGWGRCEGVVDCEAERALW